MGRWKNRLLGVLGMALVGTLALAWFHTTPPPRVEVDSDLPGIGRRTEFTITVRGEGRGLGAIQVQLIQGDRVYDLAHRRHDPRPFWAFWGPRVVEDRLTVRAGKEIQKALVEGEAALRVVVERAGSWMRQPEPVVVERTLTVRFTPPTLERLGGTPVVRAGGSGAVAFRVGETAVRSGVQAGEVFLRGFSPEGAADSRARFVVVGVPHMLEDAGAVRLVAEDELNNRVALLFLDRLVPRRPQRDVIRLSEDFMRRVVPAILARNPELEDQGDLLANYLLINRELRRRNRRRLMELAEGSRPRRMWEGAFLQMPNARVMARFAEDRTYVYEGRTVDRQVHLGYDLASIRRAKVPAANHGVVLFAGDFGIYGNAVVLDHGLGLLSLYGHLSSVEVQEGQSVRKGETLGRTGATGLAGGDHLHFAVLVQGLPVDPVEWWDPHWVRTHILSVLEQVEKPG